MVPLSAYVAVSAVLFITGLLGVLIRRNFIIVLMAVEIMLNAANINLVAFSHYLESMAGQLVHSSSLPLPQGKLPWDWLLSSSSSVERSPQMSMK